MLLAIHLGIVVLFVVLGIVFWNGKGTSLIAGYNTLSQSEKARIDREALCKFMAKFMFVLGACWLVIASSELFKSMALLWIGIALFFVATTAGVVYANTANRFR